LPDVLYGLPVVVEDTVRVSTRKGAATVTKGYVMTDGDVMFVSRPGGIKGMEPTGIVDAKSVVKVAAVMLQQRSQHQAFIFLLAPCRITALHNSKASV
jgi:hypothetical protein